MKVIYIQDEADWYKKINSKSIIVCDFTATWCGPCKRIAPKYQQLADLFASFRYITFVKIDVDDNPEISKKCNIEAMPTFQIWNEGNLLKTYKGASTENIMKIKAYINKVFRIHEVEKLQL